MLRLPIFLAGATAALLLSTAWGTAQEEAPASYDDMMAKAAVFTQPGPNHDVLKRFLGKWETQTSFVMAGTKTPPEKGHMEGSWLIDGRWISLSGSSPMMGAPVEFFSAMGYDNFRKSFVVTSMTSIDTAMNRVEGDLDREGKNLIMYGTIDEYLTGELGKGVKSIWRFLSEDEMVQEVHDLAIGETNTQVIEVRYTRVK